MQTLLEDSLNGTQYLSTGICNPIDKRLLILYTKKMIMMADNVVDILHRNDLMEQQWPKKIICHTNLTPPPRLEFRISSFDFAVQYIPDLLYYSSSLSYFFTGKRRSSALDLPLSVKANSATSGK